MQDQPLFANEPETLAQAGDEKPWRVLIVDDEPEVHRATRFALGEVRFQGRPLEFISAYSAAEAQRLLQREDDIALVFLDVVMENNEAGLALVRTIRQEIGNRDVRIVLRTGYPGLAPEYQVITDYDINDYRVKTDLTAERLYATTLAALRAYRDLMMVHRSEAGLRFIVDTVPLLLRDRERRRFAQDMLEQLSRALGVECHGAVIEGTEPPRILAAEGVNASAGEALDSLDAVLPVAMIRHCLERSEGDDQGNDLYVYLGSGEYEAPAVVWLHTGRTLEPVERQLLQVFGLNLGVALDNLSLYERTRQLAYFDSLTGLGNRSLFAQQLDAAITRQSEPGNGRLQVIMANIVRFREFNPVLGRSAGDRLLVAVGQRLVDTYSEALAVARLGADSFLLLVPGAMDPARLLESIQTPFDVVETPLRLEISIGVTRFPEDGADAETLLRNADVALGLARRDCPGRLAYYTTSLDDNLRYRLNLLQDLRGALERQELEPYFQPQIDLSSNRLVGLEALVRWHRDGTLVPPGDFIPVAESSGLIRPLGEQVLARALHERDRLQRTQGKRVRISVNVSATQLQDEHFFQRTAALIDEYGLTPGTLELEVTETAIMEDIEDALPRIDALRRLGVELAIDDFGTGYSSLAYLRRLHPDRLKIDRAFVAPLEVSEEARSIAQTIINLGHHLGIRVVAEGVETVGQRDLLQAMGCDEGQGFLWAPALPPQELETWQPPEV